MNIQLFPVTNPSASLGKTPEEIEAHKLALRESLIAAQRQADLARAAINELDKRLETDSAKQNVSHLAAGAAHIAELFK